MRFAVSAGEFDELASDRPADVLRRDRSIRTMEYLQFEAAEVAATAGGIDRRGDAFVAGAEVACGGGVLPQAPAREIRRWSLRSRESADHGGEEFAVDLLGRGVHGARSIVVADAAARILRRCVLVPRRTTRSHILGTGGFVATPYDLGQSCDLQRYWWARRGSNPRPLVCKTRALPLSYTPVPGQATRRRRAKRNPLSPAAAPPAPRSRRLDRGVHLAPSSRRTG